MDIAFTPYNEDVHPIYFYGKVTETDEFLLNYYYEIEDAVQETLGGNVSDTMVGIINDVFVLSPQEYDDVNFKQMISQLTYIMLQQNYLYATLSKKQVEYFQIPIEEAMDIIEQYVLDTGIIIYIIDVDIMEEVYGQ